jgi:hypothetical protein
VTDELADRHITAMWLAHHYPEDYDRCVRIGRAHVCRRCLVLYPLALATMVVALAVGAPTGSGSGLLAVAMVVLPIPAVAEFVLEHRGVLKYHPARQIAVTVPLGIGLGCGFARYLRAPGDLVFWAVVVVYVGICLAAALLPRGDQSAR